MDSSIPSSADDVNINSDAAIRKAVDMLVILCKTTVAAFEGVLYPLRYQKPT